MKCINVIIAGLTLISCNQQNPQELTEKEITLIKDEIKNRVDGYFEAVKVIDLEKVSNFWSDSEDFVFAGDGRILGGYEEWMGVLNQWADETDHYLHWNNSHIKVEVLSRTAASYTMEFDNERIGVSGDTLNTRGSWTYVFKKFGNTWRVIHTNGTHIDY